MNGFCHLLHSLWRRKGCAGPCRRQNDPNPPARWVAALNPLLPGYKLPLPVLARVLLWFPALSLPSAWCEFLCVRGLIPPSVPHGGGIPALAYLQLYTFRLVDACSPLPVFQTLFHHRHVMHVFQHISPTAEPHAVFSAPVVSAVIINPGA